MDGIWYRITVRNYQMVIEERIMEMKHIQEKYGMECNYIESSYDEFLIMKEFLKKHGIEARTMTYWRGDEGEKCTWQIRNPYQFYAELCRGHNGNEIVKMSEEEIKSGRWCL